MTKEKIILADLAEILKQHRLWLRGEGGSCANLSDADLSDANLSDVPTIDNIHQKIAAAIAIDGNGLNMCDWHTCDTTHCRAGWAVHLAGAAGYALEKRIGPAAAGALIYLASDPKLDRVPNFYASNDVALDDIEACAKREAGS